jgi:hypothetical protein
MRKRKEIVQTVTIPNTTPAGLQDFSFPLDRDYTNATGFFIFERSNGGNASAYRIGIRTETGTPVYDIVPKERYLSGNTVAPADRVIPLGDSLTAKGQNVIVTVQTPATATADLIFDIVYILENI